MSEQEEGKDKPKEKIELSQEEIESLQKDIDDALNKVKAKSNEGIDKIKEDAKKEAEKELQIRQELQAKEKELEDLKKQADLTNQNNQAELQALKEKMDSMISSKQVVDAKNPFKDEKINAENMPDDQIRNIEKESEQLFFQERSK